MRQFGRFDACRPVGLGLSLGHERGSAFSFLGCLQGGGGSISVASSASVFELLTSFDTGREGRQ